MLAKPLFRALGSICNSHLRNSSYLINKIKGTNLRNKILVCFDMISLFTNVPGKGATDPVKRVVNDMNEEELPLRKADYIKVVSLCVKYGSFAFENEEFYQHDGLSMGSPVSAGMACLFLEFIRGGPL